MSKSKEIKKDLEVAKSLEAVARSDGGQVIVKSMRKDLLSHIDKLANSFQTLPHSELIALCANLRANIATIRVFKNAKKNAKFLEQELEFALDEEGREES